MTWGEDTEEGEAADLLATFVDAGGTLIDTADIYQGGQENASSDVCCPPWFVGTT